MDSLWYIALRAYLMKPKIFVPHNVKFTCSQGNGALLDYVLCLRGGHHYVKDLRADVEGPTRPHLGLIMSLTDEVLATRIDVLRAPSLPFTVPQLVEKWRDRNTKKELNS